MNESDPRIVVPIDQMIRVESGSARGDVIDAGFVVECTYFDRKEGLYVLEGAIVGSGYALNRSISEEGDQSGLDHIEGDVFSEIHGTDSAFAAYAPASVRIPFQLEVPVSAQGDHGLVNVVMQVEPGATVSFQDESRAFFSATLVADGLNGGSGYRCTVGDSTYGSLDFQNAETSSFEGAGSDFEVRDHWEKDLAEADRAFQGRIEPESSRESTSYVHFTSDMTGPGKNVDFHFEDYADEETATPLVAQPEEFSPVELVDTRNPIAESQEWNNVYQIPSASAQSDPLQEGLSHQSESFVSESVQPETPTELPEDELTQSVHVDLEQATAPSRQETGSTSWFFPSEPAQVVDGDNDAAWSLPDEDMDLFESPDANEIVKQEETQVKVSFHSKPLTDDVIDVKSLLSPERQPDAEDQSEARREGTSAETDILEGNSSSAGLTDDVIDVKSLLSSERQPDAEDQSEARREGTSAETDILEGSSSSAASPSSSTADSTLAGDAGTEEVSNLAEFTHATDVTNVEEVPREAVVSHDVTVTQATVSPEAADVSDVTVVFGSTESPDAVEVPLIPMDPVSVGGTTEDVDDRPVMAQLDSSEGVTVSGQEPTYAKTVAFLNTLYTPTETRSTYTMKFRIVQSGETLQDIAERYRILTSDLMHANRLSTDEIELGTVLYIPPRHPIAPQ